MEFVLPREELLYYNSDSHCSRNGNPSKVGYLMLNPSLEKNDSDIWFLAEVGESWY